MIRPSNESKNAVVKYLISSEIKIDFDFLKFIFSLISLSGSMNKVMENHFGRYGLSQGKFSLLMLLLVNEERDWSPAEIAQNLGCTKATISGLIAGLVKSKHIKKTQNFTDSRSYYVKITPYARRQMETILPDHFSRVQKAFSIISGSKIKKNISILNEIETSFMELEKLNSV